MCLDYLQQPHVLQMRGLYELVRRSGIPATSRSFQSADGIGTSDEVRSDSGSDDVDDEEGPTELERVMKEASALRRRFDKGQEATIDLSTVTTPKVVSTLLHQYFAEMSPPLFTYRLYVKMLGTQRHESPEARLDALKPAISSLPGQSDGAQVRRQVFCCPFGSCEC